MEVFTPTSLVKNGVMLAGGFAGIITAKTVVSEAATNAHLSEAAVAALAEGVNTLASAPVFAAWAAADIMTQPLLDKAKGAIFNRKTDEIQSSPVVAETNSMASISDLTSIEIGESGRVADTGAGTSNRFASNRFTQWMIDARKRPDFGTDAAQAQASESTKAPILGISSRRSDTPLELGPLPEGTK